MRVYLPTLILLVAVSLTMGCAANPSPPPPPQDALVRMERAIGQAEQAEAAQYAPLALRDARKSRAAALEAMGEEDHLEAKRWAEKAQIQAELAETVALAEIAEARVKALKQEEGEDE